MRKIREEGRDLPFIHTFLLKLAGLFDADSTLLLTLYFNGEELIGHKFTEIRWIDALAINTTHNRDSLLA